MSKLILSDIKDNILNITLNNPASQNTLSLDTIKSLNEIILDSEKDREVKVIIIKSTGKIFSAGHNLKEITLHRQDSDKGLKFFTTLINSCSNLMLNILKIPKPVIAEVNGIATAAGCQLVATCDLAYASSASFFATPGVNIGLFCSTPMVALSRVSKNKHAMEMLLTGDLISAKKAKKIALINNYFDHNNLSNEVNLIAKKIANKSSLTLKIGKKAFYEQSEMNIIDSYNYASKIMITNMMESDADEGISAFIDKRQPKWK